MRLRPLKTCYLSKREIEATYSYLKDKEIMFPENCKIATGNCKNILHKFTLNIQTNHFNEWHERSAFVILCHFVPF